MANEIYISIEALPRINKYRIDASDIGVQKDCTTDKLFLRFVGTMVA